MTFDPSTFQPKHFLWEFKDGVATITLNRPERKNPLTFESYDELRATFYELDQEEAEVELKKVCDKAKSAVELVKKSWTDTDDEFTAWSAKWTQALDLA